MEKQKLIHLYNGILLSSTKEQITATQNSMVEFQNCYAKGNNSNTKEYTLSECNYIQWPKQTSFCLGLWVLGRIEYKGIWGIFLGQVELFCPWFCGGFKSVYIYQHSLISIPWIDKVFWMLSISQ